jgi:hypothetical protein
LHFSYLTLDGRHFLFGNLECNDHLFGEVEYLSNIPSQWNIIASENIEVSIIKTSDLTNLLERTPSLYRFFAQGIASDLCEQNTIFLTNLMHSLKFKILNDIQARQHSNIQTLPYDNATQEAERFGTSYRVYRRVIKELIDDGFLKYEDKELTICNIMMVNSYLTNEK